MKVRKETKEIRSVTLRLAEETMKKIDRIAQKESTSRQYLIERILETAMETPDFEIVISTTVEK